MKFNQPNLEGGLDLSIHEEDVGPVRIHVQNLVVVPDIDMLLNGRLWRADLGWVGWVKYYANCAMQLWISG